ncbi:MAG: PAS domain S-box-containing protein [Candidatus Azotimanducaceae bacterium]|jgi:PAS domain S-box-containing protein
MIVVLVLVCTILLLCLAAGVVLSVVKIADRAHLWVIPSLTMCLMIAERSTTLYKVISQGVTVSSVALLLPLLVAAGLLTVLYILRVIVSDLKRSEASYESMLKTSVDTYYTTDEQGKVVNMSNSVETELGYAPSELVGKSIADIYVNELDRDKFLEALIEGGDLVKGIQAYLWHKDGHTVLVESNARLTRGPDGGITGVQGIARNITDRINTEDQNSKLGKIVEAAAIEIYVFNGGSRFFSLVNNRARTNLGYSMKELSELKVEDVCPNFYDLNAGGNLERLVNEAHKILEFETVIQRKDQSQYPVEVQLQYIDSGLESVYFAVVNDVTLKRQIQLELDRSQRLQSIGQLTGGIAHDFNNMLQALQLNIESIDPSESNNIYQKDALKVVERASQLTHRLLAFSRGQTLKPSLIKVNKVLSNTIKLLERTLGKTVDIQVSLCDEDPSILVDEGQLENAILNLAINARDAMADGGSLKIESKITIPDKKLISSPLNKSGNSVVIIVSDTGVGIPPEDMDKVYEPFFTTKDVGLGTGLGLSMIYGFMKQSDGDISIESTLNEGTQVKLFFKESASAKDLEDVMRQQKLNRGKEHILLIEDEEQIRKITEEVLTRLGYKITSVSNGKDALIQFELLKNDLDLILSDVMLAGGLSGPEVIVSIQSQLKDTKVIFMTGYLKQELPDKLSEYPLLHKPFSLDQLAAQIRKVID